jgi:hypothetical protein
MRLSGLGVPSQKEDVRQGQTTDAAPAIKLDNNVLR